MTIQAIIEDVVQLLARAGGDFKTSQGILKLGVIFEAPSVRYPIINPLFSLWD